MKKQHSLRIALLFTLALALAAPVPASVAGQPALIPNADDTVYLPIVMQPLDCSTGETYGSMNVPPPVTDRPAELHGDINLALRGYSATGGTLGLVSINGDTDAKAPQLDSLLSPARFPGFKTNYRANNWYWPPHGAEPHGSRGDPIADPAVTVVGLMVTANEKIHVPNSGYLIGEHPTYHALVLYAANNRITLKYTADDSVAWGYAVHLDNLCVDPALVSLYQQLNAAGRDFLPALRHGQAVGRALSNEVIVAIRDTGAFMDPRSCKDWWKAYACP